MCGSQHVVKLPYTDVSLLQQLNSAHASAIVVGTLPCNTFRINSLNRHSVSLWCWVHPGACGDSSADRACSTNSTRHECVPLFNLPNFLPRSHSCCSSLFSHILASCPCYLAFSNFLLSLHLRRASLHQFTGLICFFLLYLLVITSWYNVQRCWYFGRGKCESGCRGVAVLDGPGANSRTFLFTCALTW